MKEPTLTALLSYTCTHVCIHPYITQYLFLDLKNNHVNSSLLWQTPCCVTDYRASCMISLTRRVRLWIQRRTHWSQGTLMQSPFCYCLMQTRYCSFSCICYTIPLLLWHQKGLFPVLSFWSCAWEFLVRAWEFMVKTLLDNPASESLYTYFSIYWFLRITDCGN